MVAAILLTKADTKAATTVVRMVLEYERVIGHAEHLEEL